jgi:hypothetical protein
LNRADYFGSCCPFHYHMSCFALLFIELGAI